MAFYSVLVVCIDGGTQVVQIRGGGTAFHRFYLHGTD